VSKNSQKEALFSVKKKKKKRKKMLIFDNFKAKSKKNVDV